MSELFAKTVQQSEPAVAAVIELHPNGVRIRAEERDDETLYWVSIFRDGRSASEHRYSRTELEDFHTRAGAALGRQR